MSRYMLKFYNNQTHEWELDVEVELPLYMVVDTLRNRLEDDIRNSWENQYMIIPVEMSFNA